MLKGWLEILFNPAGAEIPGTYFKAKWHEDHH